MLHNIVTLTVSILRYYQNYIKIVCYAIYHLHSSYYFSVCHTIRIILWNSIALSSKIINTLYFDHNMGGSLIWFIIFTILLISNILPHIKGIIKRYNNNTNETNLLINFHTTIKIARNFLAIDKPWSYNQTNT